MKYLFRYKYLFLLALSLLNSILLLSCGEQNDGLAAYEGSPGMSHITVQDSTFTPKISWLGGYVSVVGVNVGNRAALDNSLVFLIYKSGDGLHYPITFGEVPSGAQDLLSRFGGTAAQSLTEDSTYTFWVLKEEEWNSISSLSNGILILDSTLSASILIQGDSVKLSDKGYYQITKPIDNFIDIRNVSSFGKLGTITIEETNLTNNVIVHWTIDQVTDTAVAAVGIVEGGQFSSDKEIWSVYSYGDSSGTQILMNTITQPLVTGQAPPGTQVFVPYPAGGLKKNTTYYLWIAGRFWNGEGRIRTTNYYEYATFNTD